MFRETPIKFTTYIILDSYAVTYISCLYCIGCGKLYVADGNWKLRYAHCMWKVPVVIPGFGKINYPSVCPLSPKRGQAFCPMHCEKAQALGYATELRMFLKRCGVGDSNVANGMCLQLLFGVSLAFVGYFAAVSLLYFLHLLPSESHINHYCLLLI